MAIVGAIIFFVLRFIIINPFMNFMSNNQRIIEAGSSYLRIVMMFSAFSIIEIVLTKILQGMGRMIIPMIAQLIGAITNIILDPIFIFGYLGLPALGVSGAAIATVISQFIAMVFVIIVIIKSKTEINLGLKKFKIKLAYIGQILQVGLPSFIMNVIGSLTSVFLNKIVTSHDSTEITNGVLVSYSKLQSFVFMPIFGLNQRAIPILSYNFGANIKGDLQSSKNSIYVFFYNNGYWVFNFPNLPRPLIKNLLTKPGTS